MILRYFRQLRSSKKLLMVALVIAAVVLLSWYFFLQFAQQNSSHIKLGSEQTPTPERRSQWEAQYTALKNSRLNRAIVEINSGGRSLLVEVVNTPESITQGLSGREGVTEDGMLFVFSSPREATFWMPEMQFDLDMIWIRDGSIRGITEDVPRPQEGQPLATLPRYPSPGEVEMVLEVPAGFARASGISSGDSVEIVLPE